MGMRNWAVLLAGLCAAGAALAGGGLSGRIEDPQGNAVAGAALRLEGGTGTLFRAASDGAGLYSLDAIPNGVYRMVVEAAGFIAVTETVILPEAVSPHRIRFSQVAPVHDSILVSAESLEPRIEQRNAETFNRTLFTRDDQVFAYLSAGIDAGQHEGGGKSLEIRRFGFNLDHGGVNGGLKVLVDSVPQNQGTQGHGQGYLGALKALIPELIQDVVITNGPFSAEHGDFSGLGVVEIRQRESLPADLTLRLQGGNLDTRRAFVAYSPALGAADAYLAYEAAYTDGPFERPLRYRRNNVNASYARPAGARSRVGARALAGTNRFSSSGQLPLDLVSQGRLDRFGSIDDSGGGAVELGTVSAFFSAAGADGHTLRLDGFLSRTLFDLDSNFTFFRDDPVHGDAIRQHDSRLEEGFNAHYAQPHRAGSASALFAAGGNFHASQINVGLDHREKRIATSAAALANAGIANGAAYVQDSIALLNGRLVAGGGIRYDEFRFAVADRLNPAESGVRKAGRWQAKGNAALTPVRGVPLTLHWNYGRGINSADARAVVEKPDQPRIATTGFYQTGVSFNSRRFSAAGDAFLIDHSNEQVYIPDDGSFEFLGPSRAYGVELKASLPLGRHVSLGGGITKIANAFYRGGDHRVYVDRAPHFAANAAITVASWRGWSGSLSMRAVNHYRLDGEDPPILAGGHTVFDIGLARQLRRGIELNLSADNLTNRRYCETQNYFASRITPDAPVLMRIHGTPGYPLTVAAGLTFRLGAR